MPRALNLSKSYLIFGVNPCRERRGDIWEDFHFQGIFRRKLIFAGLFAFLLIFTYIFQINLTVKRNYEIRNFESQILNLQQENQKLKVEALSLESPLIISERAKYLGMEESYNIKYVKVFTPTFVQNR